MKVQKICVYVFTGGSMPVCAEPDGRYYPYTLFVLLRHKDNGCRVNHTRIPRIPLT